MQTFYLHQHHETNIGTKKCINNFDENQRYSLLSRLSPYEGKYKIKTVIKNIQSDGEFLLFKQDNVLITNDPKLLEKIDDIINKYDGHYLIYSYSIKNYDESNDQILKKLSDFSHKHNVKINIIRDNDLVYIKFIDVNDTTSLGLYHEFLSS